ncbi:hypothetical protein C8R47DRAFT_1268746 [Mycena vitilis]|nr:hypothetical protein C8R47DRAFT_1268746 [Mycena vitilis]
MPGRHVRFSSTDTIHSIPSLSRSPSPSSSNSSAGPSTPPPLYYASPGPALFSKTPRPSSLGSSSSSSPSSSKRPRPRPSSLPASSSSSNSSAGPSTPPPPLYKSSSSDSKKSRSSCTTKRQAHHLVALGAAPILRYDVSLSPSTVSTHHPNLPSAAFSEPAVYPPQSSLSLVTPHLPWAILVPASNGRFVTVADLLSALHRTLRANATGTEFEALRSDKLKRRVGDAYVRRCERLRGHRGYEHEKKAGLKRVDFLMGYTAFQGIAPSSGGRDWQLVIA